MEKNLERPVMQFQYEAEPIEGLRSLSSRTLTNLSSHTQKSPKDTLVNSFNENKPVKAMPLLKVGKFLGSGAYGAVYHATTRSDESTQLVLALKKSRTSLRVKRPSLKHEARVLQLLRGHPAILSVYGYGRLRHFEYLAMELLASSLEDLHKDHTFPLRAVLAIADQMLSALGHIHTHGIIHQDIKPSNILVDFNNQLRLIDFGIARRFIPGESIRHNSPVEAHCVLGTLDWASLHAHYGYELGPRDDLESLAYTLLFLLRGDLPWRRYSRSIQGTLAGRAAQVRQKKITWTGSMLAGSHSASFGDLLDSVRSLSFHGHFDYDGWRSIFRKIACDHEYSITDDIDWTVAGNAKLIPPAPTPSSRPSIPPCVVRAGQLVYVQVLSRITIEGHSCQADASYWHDPDLSGDYWMTKRRPAIVLRTGLKEKKYYVIKVIPIKLGPQAPGSIAIRLTNMGSATDACSVPGWPLDDAFCYVFPHLQSFVSVAEATPVPLHWRMKRKDVKSLLDKFDKRPPVHLNDISPEDSNKYNLMRWRSIYEIYADFTPMTPENIIVPPSDNVAVDWFGERGWFDELLRINRKRSAQDGDAWPSSNPDRMKGRENYSNSYWGADLDIWHIHRERGRSLTLPASEAAQLDREIDIITDLLDDESLTCGCEQCQENICPS